MKREICRINMAIVDDGENTVAEGHIRFKGGKEHMVHTIAHIFTAMDLDPMQALLLSVEAVDVMRGQEADDE